MVLWKIHIPFETYRQIQGLEYSFYSTPNRFLGQSLDLRSFYNREIYKLYICISIGAILIMRRNIGTCHYYILKMLLEQNNTRISFKRLDGCAWRLDRYDSSKRKGMEKLTRDSTTVSLYLGNVNYFRQIKENLSSKITLFCIFNSETHHFYQKQEIMYYVTNLCTKK